MSLLLPAGGATVSVVPATVTYVDDDGDDSDATSYTFTSLGTGTADDNRQVFIVVSYIGGGYGGQSADTLTSVTIGGNTATIHATIVAASPFWVSSIVSYPLTSGTSTTVVVSMSGTSEACAVNSFSVIGASSTASDTLTSSATTPTGTIDCPANGVIIGGACRNQTSSWTWVGITERFDGSFEGGEDNGRSVASLAFAAAQSGLTITATPAAGTHAPAMSVASFGPA